VKQAPYSLNEAQQICEDYQFLVGQAFDTASPIDSTIESVALAPFDQINKRRFIIFYLLFNDARSALTHEYKGLLYDILVIARSTDNENEIMQESLAVWLSKNAAEQKHNLNRSAEQHG
jgi:hypothetical protein